MKVQEKTDLRSIRDLHDVLNEETKKNSLSDFRYFVNLHNMMQSLLYNIYKNLC